MYWHGMGGVKRLFTPGAGNNEGATKIHEGLMMGVELHHCCTTSKQLFGDCHQHSSNTGKKCVPLKSVLSPGAYPLQLSWQLLY